MSLEHLDVIIVGAGLSGVSAAYHLQTYSRTRSFTILDARDAMGGTWDLFRYPGIRSDSDMYTLGYRFRPWNDPKAIADGPAILEYIRATAREYGIDQEVRYGHRVTRASWSSEQAQWTLEAETDDGTARFTCDFLYMCSGYYDYGGGYTPEFAGTERFRGRIVHPQQWPGDLDYAGKRVVVIGSGATAVTLVPAMAEKAAHVTMLQRSPTYIVERPSKDAIANGLRRVLPGRLAYRLARWKNVAMTTLFYQLSRRRPEFMKRLIKKGVRDHLGPAPEIDRHFTPRYDPWDQRLCLVPDADLFQVLKQGHASVATDQIDTFTETGLRLASGEELEADLVVTATGLNLKLMGGMEVVVDARPIDLADTMSYKGMMFSDIPNLAYAFGYTNASWTLKCDLTAQYVTRLLNYMEKHDYVQATPRHTDPEMGTEPALDLTSGYVQRALANLPRQGSRKPWKLHQNYARDLMDLRFSKVDDEVMEFVPAGIA